MFSRFFHLKENPFGETPNMRFFYSSRTHLLALHLLVQSYELGKGFAAVIGEVGTGKTLLGRLFLKILDDQNVKTALILQPLSTEAELIQQISHELGRAKGAQVGTVKEEMDQLSSLLIEGTKRGERFALIIDEAHRLSFESLEIIRLISNIETDEQKLIQIYFFGQPELKRKLDVHSMRQLRQRLSVSFQLESLSIKETANYLQHRIEKAGGANFVRFEESAARQIYQQCRGIPRLINFYAELCLLYAHQHETRLIDKKLLKLATAGIDAPQTSSPFRRLFEPHRW